MKQATTPPPARTVWRKREVLQQVGLSNTTLYKRINAGDFPKPVSLGGKAVGWLAADVTAWLNDKIKARDAA